MPGSIRQLITKKLIILDLEAKDKYSAIIELARLMEREGKLNSTPQYLKAVGERETLTTTAVGLEVAIPHARSPAVRQTAIAFGKSKGFRWDRDGQEVVRLVFLLAVSSENPNKEYMGLLASLARMLVDEGFRDSLLKATDRDDVMSTLERASLRH